MALNVLHNDFVFDTFEQCTYYDCESLHGYLTTDQNSLNVIHMNIRSCNRNFNEFAIFINQTGVEFPVIVLTETWLTAESDWLNILGYRAFHSIRGARAGGGVTILVSDRLNSDKKDNLCRNSASAEILAVEVDVGTESFTIFGVYRPPLGSVFSFRSEFSEILSREEQGNCILTGDFNIDILKDHLTQDEDDFIDDLKTKLFLPLISIPTRVTNTTATCIDHIYFNSFVPCKFGVVNVAITDHFPVFISVPVKANCPNKSFTTKFRDFSPRYFVDFRKDLLDSLSVFNSFDLLSIDDRFEIFANILQSSFDKCFPIRKKVVSFKRFCCPWLTDSLLRCIKRKHTLHLLSKRNSGYLNEFKRYRNVLCESIRQAKKQYFGDKFEQVRSDSRGTWRVINDILQPKSNKNNSFRLDLPDGTTECPDKIANAFNAHFVSVAPNLSRDIPPTNFDPVSLITPNLHSFVYFDAPPCEVERTILSFKNKNSSINFIPSFVYRSVANIISPILSVLINESFNAGIFPSILKVARVVPIPKSGSQNQVENFRPISTIHFLSKVIERLIYTRILDFINKFNILNDVQYGFRKGKSTGDAVLTFTQNCYEALNDKKYLVSVFLDFKKAFDTVDHGILLRKLHCYGFRGTANSWFESYLENRFQYVDIHGTCSAKLPITTGVQQGSILGPLLFLLYINDFYLCSNFFNFVHFADDSTIYAKGDNFADLIESINGELTGIDHWLRGNKLSLNIGKTKFMIFSNNNFDVPILKIRDEQLEYVDKIKFLGVIVDSKLRFTDHIKGVCSKVARVCGIFNRLLFIPPNVRRTMYFSLVYPYLIYAIEVWGCASGVLIRRLTSLQNRVVERIDRSLPVDRVYFQYRLLKFSSVYKLCCLMKFYRFVKLEQNATFAFLAAQNSVHHSYQTRFRDSHNINIPRIHSSRTYSSFFYNSIKFWNELPLCVKNLPTVGSFKRELLSKYYALLGF